CSSASPKSTVDARVPAYCGSHFVLSRASCWRPSSSELNSATTSRPWPAIKARGVKKGLRAPGRHDRDIIGQALPTRALQQAGQRHQDEKFVRARDQQVLVRDKIMLRGL